MFIKKEDIQRFLEKSPYKKYLGEIIELIKVHHKNYQYLLLNKELFRHIPTYGKKKNKFFYEHLNENNFNILISKIINFYYSKYNFENINENLFIRLYDKKKDIQIDLKEKGIYLYPELLNQNKCIYIINQINHKQYINRKNNLIKKINLYDPQNDIWWLNNYQDLLNIDLVQHILSSSYLLNIAQTYFGCKPILHHFHFWASYPGDLESTQIFHQDFDDIRFLKVFIYLNDVDSNNGPHCYVQKSLQKAHEIIPIENKLSERLKNEFVEEHFGEDILHIEGNAGTMIIEDTHGIHKGTHVKKGKRFLFQIIYGCSTFYPLKTTEFKKYKCNIKDHKILYDAYLKYPYSFMNFNFEK